jgi:DNA helicase-2/ATP-dependent DNA helicase PcrA
MSFTPTAEQEHVIQHGAGHAIVDAAPGSGKSATMIGRVAHLLRQGYTHRAILVLMFNSSAQVDFKARLNAQLVEEGLGAAPGVWTFHAYGLEVLNWLAKTARRTALTLVQEGAYNQLCRDAIALVNKAAGKTLLESDAETVQRIKETLDRLKSGLILPQLTVLHDDPLRLEAALLQLARSRTDEDGLQAMLAQLQAALHLEALRKAKQLITFIDMVYEPYLFLLSSEGQPYREMLANRYRHIIIDEFQDIDDLQMRFIALIAGQRAQLMVVGDGDQCIYEWRGAQPEYIVRQFGEIFANPVRYQLSYTFRYGPAVSDLANRLIAHNQNRILKSCQSWPGLHTEVTHWHRPTFGDGMLAALEAWREQGGLLEESVVLVREYAQTIPLELTLSSCGIPYRIEGNVSFIERREMLMLRGYLAMASGQFWTQPDNVRDKQLSAMLAIPNLFLKKASVEDLKAKLLENDDAEAFYLTATVGIDALKALSGRNTQGLDRLQALFGLAQRSGSTQPAAGFIQSLIDAADLARFFFRSSPKKHVGSARFAMFQYVRQFAEQRQMTLSQLLSQFAGMSRAAHAAHESAILMTSCFRAKGLQWPHVIVAGLEEGAFPVENHDDLEAERRLFFVAITRAVKQLSLLSRTDPALEAWLAANGTQTMPEPERMLASRFLYEALAPQQPPTHREVPQHAA